ncbi:hypothetical protein NKJ26_12880 [Mesorhizobium sp. M0152]|uniref:hypothetical protein n=1 Tax=Mesorhizobium sp. M0152 TaxID=2956898 RepID=UPI003338CE04
MAGPWEKYQTTPDVPPGFRIVSQPASSKPRFPGVPVDLASDPWAAFPDALAAKQPPASPIGPFPGLLEQGNIDLKARPIVKNDDGSYSTVRSMSFENNGGQEVLVPTVADGKILSDRAAMELYGKTGQNLGKFDNPAHADMYAGALHKAQDQHYGAQAQPAGNVFDQFDTPAAPGLSPGFKIISHPASAKAARVGSGAFSSTNAGGTAEGPWTKYQAAAEAPNDLDPGKSDPWVAFPDTIPAGFKVVGQPGPWDKYAARAQSTGSPIEVKAPDGTTVQFPAGTTDDVMAKAMRETFGGPSDKLSVAKDVGLSFASGVPRGAVETAMTPITLNRVGEGIGSWLFDKAEGPVRSALGMEPATPGPEHDRFKDFLINPLTGAVNYGLRTITGNDNADLRTGIYDAQDRTREGMDAVLHKPETTTGKYAGTIGEFAAPGGLPSKAARLAGTGREIARHIAEDMFGNVVMPAVASEASGQATEGTPYEGLSRFLGALFGNAGTAAGRAYNAPESVVRRATSEMTDADWQRALGLQDNTTGVRLTGPEAIAQATNGASALPNLLRVVEGSVDGRARTAPFFTARPAQVDQAVTNVFDQIAPQSAQPYSLGPRAAEAAANVIDQTRQGINGQTRPLYDAAQQQIIPQPQFAPIAADPRFAAGLARLRGNPELAPDYAHLPDSSIGVVDAVTKDLNARGEALSTVTNPLYGPELASRSTASAAEARNLATNHSPEYAQALAEQEALRRTVLNPLEQGPVGRVAAAKDTAGAGNAILPQNPLTGSAGEAAGATRRLVAEDPATTTQLVRQNLADRFSKANTETQEGVRDFAGAKFHKDVAGNDARQEVLDAVLRQIPGGQAAVSMPELLDVLQATGRRKQIGSATEFNRSMNADLGGAASPTGMAVNLAKSLGTSVVKAGDVAKRAALRSNLKTLADMFIDPRSVELIRNANNRGARIGFGEALARTGAETGGTLYAPRGD